MDRSRAEGALVEALKAPRGMGCGHAEMGCTLPPGGFWGGVKFWGVVRPLPELFIV